jgi:hypothetical protein
VRLAGIGKSICPVRGPHGCFCSSVELICRIAFRVVWPFGTVLLLLKCL